MECGKCQFSPAKSWQYRSRCHRNTKSKNTLSIFIRCLEEEQFELVLSVFNRELNAYVKIEPISEGEQSYAVYQGDLLRVEWNCTAAANLKETVLGQLKNVGFHNFICVENRQFDFELVLFNGTFRKQLKIYPFVEQGDFASLPNPEREQMSNSKMDEESISSGKFLQWVKSPRLVLSIAIALVIAKPLELQIFKSEIDQVLYVELKENVSILENDYQQKILNADTEKKQLNQELRGYFELKEKYYEEYRCECDGTCGTGKAGDGKECTRKKIKYDDFNQEYQSKEASIGAALILIEQNKKIYTQNFEDEKETLKSNFSYGLLARIKALNGLGGWETWTDSVDSRVFDSERDFAYFIVASLGLQNTSSDFSPTRLAQKDSLYKLLNTEKEITFPISYLSEFSDFMIDTPVAEKIMSQTVDLAAKDKLAKFTFEVNEGDRFFLKFDVKKGGGIGMYVEVLFNNVKIADELSLKRKGEFALDFEASKSGKVDLVFRNFGLLRLQGNLDVEVLPRKLKIKLQEEKLAKSYEIEENVLLKDTLFSTLLDDSRRETIREDGMQDFAWKELVGKSYTYLPEFRLKEIDFSVYDQAHTHHWINGLDKQGNGWQLSPNSKRNYAFFAIKKGFPFNKFTVRVANKSSLYDQELGLQGDAASGSSGI
ncbi:hypothetical protein GHT06_004996 [Daphnia sinensis]|uniref:Uncharacterized protein n=1 Tax=Daphnia sinensis TaxID=1820382 RepID=A0AAD5KFI2_9CRUS|nr:hypothetical protein GHT06_004996 [Daphnia sinensis]